jgi:xylose isomerase
MSDYTPKPEHKFTFGLWTVGNPGRDPFGEPTRAVVDPNDSVRKWPNWALTASTSMTTI